MVDCLMMVIVSPALPVVCCGLMMCMCAACFLGGRHS